MLRVAGVHSLGDANSFTHSSIALLRRQDTEHEHVENQPWFPAFHIAEAVMSHAHGSSPDLPNKPDNQVGRVGQVFCAICLITFPMKPHPMDIALFRISKVGLNARLDSIRGTQMHGRQMHVVVSMISDY